MIRIAIVAAAALALAGCNTVAGVGKDMSAVGHVMTKTANDAARAKPIRAACVQDSRVPPRTCPTAPARSSTQTKTAAATKTTQTAQASGAKPVSATSTPPATPVKSSTKAKSGWWQ